MLGWDSLLWLGLLPVVLLIIDVATVFFSRSMAPPGHVPPRLQFWLQDFLLLALASAAALAWSFSNHKAMEQTGSVSAALSALLTAAARLLPVVLGFGIAVDLCSVPKLSARSRALIFAGVLALSVFAVWLPAMLWWTWKRWRAFRSGPRYAARTPLFVLIAVALYGAAFLLPIKISPTPSFISLHNMLGYAAYLFCFAEFFGREWWVILTLAWLANPLFWAAAAFFLEGRRWLCVGLALLAMLLALAAHQPDCAVYNSPAYGTWFFSMALLGAFAAFGGRITARPDAKKN